MEASEVPASELFADKVQLRIPIWQRTYAWGRPQWLELWDDISRAARGTAHFVGSVVVLEESGRRGAARRADRLTVVDGQQRAATLTVLIAAIRDRMVAATQVESDARDLFDQVTLDLLKNDRVDPEYAHKLVLQDTDDESLASIVNGVEPKPGNLRDAYEFFQHELSGVSVSMCETLLETIQSKLEIVFITLDPKDNVHRIFQTLNAGGKPLKQSDLVRNYFFLLLAGPEGEKFYRDYWSPMESLLESVGLERFFAAWMQANGQSGSIGSLFHQFQQDLKILGDETKKVLEYGKSLARASSIFFWMFEPSGCPSKQLQASLADFKIWDTRAAEGLLLQILLKSENGDLTSEQASASVELVLSFFARRQLAGYEPNLHKSITRQYAHELYTSGSVGDDYVLELNGHLSRGPALRRFPRDEEILRVGTSRPLYSRARANWTFLILDRINRARYPKKKMATPMDRSTNSIEHVMPQNLSPEWREDLEKWGIKDITATHDEFLHTIGNLTITPVNSELSDDRYEVKRPLLVGQEIPLNREFDAESIWRPQEIRQRSESLIADVLRVFARPLDVAEATESEDLYEELEDEDD